MREVLQDELWYGMLELCLGHSKHGAVARKMETEAESLV